MRSQEIVAQISKGNHQIVVDLDAVDFIDSTGLGGPTVLMAAFAGIALTLAAVGVYGVTAFAVGQRTHEIGIRMALGAQAADVRRMLLRSGMRAPLVGMVAGLGLAAVAVRLIESFLYGVSAADPWTYVAVVVLLGFVAGVLALIPFIGAFGIALAGRWPNVRETVTLTTAVFLTLIVVLSVRIRQPEMETLSKIGCARRTAFWLQAIELGYLVAFSIVWIVACLSSVTVAVAAESRPNVILVMTDDQGWAEVGFHGNKVLKTPNLDRFAAEGTELTNFYVSPMCTPTRSSLMTGRYHFRTGAHDTYIGRSNMKPEEKEFLLEKIRSASWLIKSIDQRQRTIYRVTKSILEKQLNRSGRTPAGI